MKLKLKMTSSELDGTCTENSEQSICTSEIKSEQDDDDIHDNATDPPPLKVPGYRREV